MSFNKTHPECRSDEVFVTNADADSWSKIGWQTKRKGNTAYDSEGKPPGKRWHGAYPVFVKKAEISGKDPKTLARLTD